MKIKNTAISQSPHLSGGVLTPLFFALLAFTGLSGCFSATPPHLSNILRVQLSAEPISLDPALAEDGVALQILYNIAEGLVGYNGKGQLENRLAEKIDISQGKKRYEFTLRKGARWSDGRLILPQDFVDGFQRTLSPSSTSKLASMFFPIRGARAYHEGKASAESMGVFEKKGKLIFELERPVPYFIETLTLPCALPIRKDELQRNQGRWDEKFPVTGPYTIRAHPLEQKIELEANSYYWGHKPEIERVDFWIVSDESTGLNLFNQGQLHILTRIPLLDFPRMKETGLIHSVPYSATYYLSFNCRKPPFDSRLWRRAFSGAIHRPEVVSILGTGDRPAWSWIPFGLEGYWPYQNPSLVFQSAIEAVRGEMATHSPVAAEFDQGLRNQRIMEKVQQDALKVLGLKVTLTPYDWKTYNKGIQSHPPAIYRMGWMAPFQDPIMHLKAFTSESLYNYAGFSNSRYDALVKEIEVTPPGLGRVKKIDQAQKILVIEEAAVVPLYHYVQNIGVSSQVSDFEMNAFGMISLHMLKWASNKEKHHDHSK